MTKNETPKLMNSARLSATKLPIPTAAASPATSTKGSTSRVIAIATTASVSMTVRSTFARAKSSAM